MFSKEGLGSSHLPNKYTILRQDRVLQLGMSQEDHLHERHKVSGLQIADKKSLLKFLYVLLKRLPFSS